MARLQRCARRKRMFRQKPQAKPMDGRDIGPLDRHGFGYQPVSKKSGPDAFAQFACGRFGESHGKDVLWAHDLAFDPVGQLRLDAMGFSCAGAGGNNDQPVV